jgi:hypothetical protein
MEIDHKEFTQRWIKNLIESIDVHLNEETKIRLLKCSLHVEKTRRATLSPKNLPSGASSRKTYVQDIMEQLSRR